MMRRLPVLLLILGLSAGCAHVRQQAVLHYEPDVPQPAYDDGQGPRVVVDEAHCNFHRAGGRFAPFTELPLLLIADHMPVPGAATGLADAFGLAFIDGYARADAGGPAIRFERDAGSLGEHRRFLRLSTNWAFCSAPSALIPNFTTWSARTISWAENS
jgi:hypothetical protein